MTTNKLPPLPERDDGKAPHDRLWDTQWVNIVNHPDVLGARDQEEAVHLAVKMTEQKMAENFRALRQSQSLPAGAVAYDRELIASMLDSAANGRTGYKATSMRDQAELLRAADNADAAGVHTAALQADAREKGEAGHKPVAFRWLRNGLPVCSWTDGVPPETAMQRADDLKGYADWQVEYAYSSLATQPAQASEPWVGICRDEHCADIGTVHDYCRPLALGPSTHPQPVTPAGGEVRDFEFLRIVHAYLQKSYIAGVQEITLDELAAVSAAIRSLEHPPVADAALLRDAERYRWLRDTGVSIDPSRPWLYREGADAAIDAALNQRGGGDHG